MSSPQSLFLPAPWARLISITPEKQDIHIFQETLEDNQVNAQWRISRNLTGEAFIKNIAASHLKVDGFLLQKGQEKRLLGGERFCFKKKSKIFDYVFCCLVNPHPESLGKLTKIENDLQKELTCSICTNLLQKCMTLTPCQHSFCSFCLFGCIKLSNQCPLCRAEAVSVVKNSVLSNVVQIVAENFPQSLQTPQARKDLEQISLAGTIIRNEEGVYIGSYVNGRKEGQGKIIYKSGGIYEGGWKNNKGEGKGTMLYKSGNRYDGFWVNDRKHGAGKFMWTDGQEYEGNYHNDLRTGYGVMRYVNGMVYKGEWKGGKREGKGVTTYSCGDKYDGDWVNDLYNGTGKYVWKNGDEYEGSFHDGRRAGPGKMKSKDGRIYQGEWKNDQREGAGTFTASNGDRYEGKWVKDVIQSQVKIEYSNGEKYEGEIEAQSFKKQGKGILIFKNGDRFEGFWDNDEQHGNGRQISRDGKILYEGVWQEGRLSFEGADSRK